MTKQPSKRGTNPNSLANLPQKKEGLKRTSVRLTEEQKERIAAIARDLGISDGMSGLLQAIGDGRVKVMAIETDSVKSDLIDNMF